MIPRVAITMGDPAGIGPELCLRVLQHPTLRRECIPIVLGDAAVLRRVAERCALPAPDKIVRSVGELATATEPVVYDLGAIEAADVTPGAVSAATGAAAYHYIETAITLALAGQVDAICTAPIHKEALRQAGVPFAGHTEILAARTHTQDYCMMLTSPRITCSLVTTHVGYREGVAQITTPRILRVIELTAAAMRRIRGRAVKLAVCGLNPHAGEHGLFGEREEELVIRPAIEQALGRGINVEGPLPPDTAFLPARLGQTDAFVCMYHDQGLIPLKTLAFDEAINITLGLPIIRTSVDHGTALDIAWQGKASPNSLFEALRLAARLARDE